MTKRDITESIAAFCVLGFVAILVLLWMSVFGTWIHNTLAFWAYIDCVAYYDGLGCV